MKIDFKDIPEGKTWKDYPPDTIFVFSESNNRKIDPETGMIIREPDKNNDES